MMARRNYLILRSRRRRRLEGRTNADPIHSHALGMRHVIRWH
jgi:hypothetical protein